VIHYRSISCTDKWSRTCIDVPISR